MNDSEPQWFYSREGQQKGPVSLAELKSLATAGTLNPRHNMVWKEGMKDWQPAGEVDGIFERRELAVEPAKAAAAPANPDPYMPPTAEGTDAGLLQQATWPGARRRAYILMALVVPFFWQIGIALVMPLMGEQVSAEAVAITAGISWLVIMVLAIYFGIQRLANVGMSRWWYLGNLVPILNLWLGYRMLACPAGYAYHKKLDGPGIVLAILYWGLIALLVLAVVGVILLGAGLAGSPEIQQQLEQIMESLRESSEP